MKHRTAVTWAVATSMTETIVLLWQITPRDERLHSISSGAVTSSPAKLTISLSDTATPIKVEGKSRQADQCKKTIPSAIERTNVPTNFWGKIVDPDEHAIEGVRVRYSYSTEHWSSSGAASGEQKIHKSEVRTDASGMFAISGIRGHALTVEAFQKENYQYDSRGTRTYNYYGDTSSGRFAPDPAEPVVFVMNDEIGRAACRLTRKFRPDNEASW